MRIIGVCLSRTRSVIRGNSRQYILIAGLYRLPSVVVSLSTFVSRLSPITYCQFIVSSDHQFFNSSLFFAFLQLTPLLPCLRWRPVDGCCLLAPHLSGVAVWRRNFAAAVCDACRHPSPCSVAGTGLLVTTWCRLLPVCHSDSSSTSWKFPVVDVYCQVATGKCS